MKDKFIKQLFDIINLFFFMPFFYCYLVINLLKINIIFPIILTILFIPIYIILVLKWYNSIK